MREIIAFMHEIFYWSHVCDSLSMKACASCAIHESACLTEASMPFVSDAHCTSKIISERSHDLASHVSLYSYMHFIHSTGRLRANSAQSTENETNGTLVESSHTMYVSLIGWFYYTNNQVIGR